MLRQKLYLGQGAQQELTTLSTPEQVVCFTKTSPHLLTFTTLSFLNSEIIFAFLEGYICQTPLLEVLVIFESSPSLNILKNTVKL